MSSILLDQMKRLIWGSIEQMHLPQVELGVVVMKEKIKVIHLENSGVEIPFSMCEFNQNLQNYTIRVQMDGGEIQEMKIFNELQLQERVAVTPIDGGRRCIVHHKVVSGLYDGL